MNIHHTTLFSGSFLCVIHSLLLVGKHFTGARGPRFANGPPACHPGYDVLCLLRIPSIMIMDGVSQP